MAIARLSRRLRPTKAAVAAGLTPTRSAVLQTVARRGAIRLSELAEAEAINPTMLSRVIAELTEGGLLERVSDERDRRAVWVSCSPAGRRLAERIRRERTDALSLGLERLTYEEQELIERAVPALERLAEQLRGGRP